MIKDILFFFSVQRNIFGICPESGELFRLSDCKVYLKTRPKKDWMDTTDAISRKLDLSEEKLDQKEESMREIARKKGRGLANAAIQQIDSVFTPRQLNPDDAKVIFHPIDYVVFAGMKGDGPIKRIVLLDRIPKSSEHRRVQDSIATAIAKKHYQWRTIRVHQDGKISEE
jgi:predicted Holliday junction resolvase-like endonuclease